ncbi:MAG: hypothetical protein ACFFDN_21640, partial [Candidatus Hodarchaeota archaeon]
MTKQNEEIVSLIAVKGDNLSTPIYRGFAPLADLSKISRAYKYDPDENPNGTQRDLNKKHAWEAYQYALNASPDQIRMWPEIILNIRSSAGITFESRAKAKFGTELCKIKINLQKINRTETNPSISRVDGNHRLFYAGGEEKYGNKFPKGLEVLSPFAILENVSTNDERRLFIDINNNQRGVDTSHLTEHMAKLSPEDELWMKEPWVWIARELSVTDTSPFKGLVWPGGPKK